MWRQARHVGAEQHNSSFGRSELAADEIEQRGLASTVGPDNGVPLATVNRQVHTVDGLEAAELSGYVREHEAGGIAHLLTYRRE